MKKFFIFFFLFLSSTIFTFSKYETRIYYFPDVSTMKAFIQSTESLIAIKMDSVALKHTNYLKSNNNSYEVFPSINDNTQFLLLFIDSASSTIANINGSEFKGVYINSPGTNSLYKNFQLNKSRYFNFDISEIESKNGLILRFDLDIIKGLGSIYENTTHFGIYYKSIYSYNTFINTPGFWMPIGLFATDFKSDSLGILFNVMPINLAYGVKFAISKYNYLGLSATFSWNLIAKKNKNTTQDSYYLSEGSIGLLFDINNYLYVGYSYNLNFSNTLTYKNFLVFGVAPGALNVFSGQK